MKGLWKYIVGIFTFLGGLVVSMLVANNKKVKKVKELKNKVKKVETTIKKTKKESEAVKKSLKSKKKALEEIKKTKFKKKKVSKKEAEDFLKNFSKEKK